MTTASISRPLPVIVTAIAIIFALRVFGFMAVLPLLMVHGQQYAGATTALLGCAIGVYGLTQAMMQMVMGALSDRIGRHTVVILGLVLLMFGSYLAAHANSVYTLIAGRALQGTGAIGSTLMALLSDWVPEAHRGKSMACVGVGIGGAFWLSVILGPVLWPHLGLSGLFNLMTVLGGLAILILIICVPRSSIDPPQQPIWVSWWHVVQRPLLRYFDGGVACLHAIFTLTFAFLPEVFGSGHRLETQAMWTFMLPGLLGSLFISFPCIAWAERHCKLQRAIVYGAVALGAASLVWAGFWHYWSLACVALVLFLSGFNILEALLMSGVSRVVDRSERGVALGVYSTSQFLGVFMGGALGGVIKSFFDLTGVFCFNFGLVCLLGLCLWGIHCQSGLRMSSRP